MNEDTSLMLWIDVITCITMYGIAHYLNSYGQAIRMCFRFSDPSIHKPFLPLIIPFLVIVIGSFVGVGLLLWITNETFATTTTEKLLLKYLFGWLCVINSCMITKSFVGKLRPNFLSMNKTKVEQGSRDESLKDHSFPEGKTSLQKTLQRESRKSFFSGHAALGTFYGVFLAIYLQNAFHNSLLRFVLQVAVILVGLVPGITQHRIYWHDAVDVSSGHLVGATCAALSHFYVYSSHQSSV